MNFLIFCADQQRSESLDLYGHPLTRMSHYRRLAERGAVFESAFCQSVLCTPSRCSFLTGLYPHANGHRSLWHLLRPHEPNLFRALRQKGYHIGLFGKNDVFAPRALSSSLDEYVCPPGSNSGPRGFSPDDPRFFSFVAEPHPGGPEGTKDAATVQAACDYLARRAHSASSQPFLCFVPITLPHPAYGPPEPYYSRYSANDIPPLRPPVTEDDLDAYPAFHRHMRSYRRLNELDDAFFRQVNALYLGMNDYVDDLFGRLLDSVERNGLAGNTTVIIMSDHGDFAGDYGLVEKYHSAHYDCKTRVPLVIAPPGQAARRVQQPVELVDLPATIAELAGIELPYTHHSRSLLPLMNGGTEDPEALAFAENGFNLDEDQCFEFLSTTRQEPDGIYYPQSKQMTERPESMPRTLMVRSATDKLILRPREISEFYNLQSDPRETVNRIADPACADRIARLKSRTLDWLILTSDVTPKEHDPRFFSDTRWQNE